MVRMSWLGIAAALACAVLAVPAEAWPPESVTTWAKTYGGTASDTATVIEQTGDGGFLAEGTTASFGAGQGDAWLFKLDSSGTPVWQKTFGTSQADSISLQTASGGGYWLTGTYPVGGQPQFVLAKVDASETIVWQKTYGAPGDGYAGAYVLSDGFLVFGTKQEFIPPATLRMTIKLIRLDASGNITWQKNYAESGGTEFYSGIPFPLDGGGFLVAGTKMDMESGEAEPWLMKLDASGTILWQKTYKSADGNSAGGFPLPTADGGYLLQSTILTGPEGSETSDVWLLKLTATGEIEWQKRYGGPQNEFGTVVALSGGGYLLSGNTDSFGAGGDDIWLVKLDASGSILWQKTFGGPGDDMAFLTPDSAGGWLLQGDLSVSRAQDDIWVAKLNDTFDIVWQRAYGGSQDDSGFAMRLPGGGLLLSGDTKSYGAGDNDFFLALLDANGHIDGCSTFIRDTSVTPGTSSATVTATTAVVEATSVSASAGSATVGTGILVSGTASATTTNICSAAPQLTATASANPTSGAAPLAVQFTGGASNGTQPYSWSWNFGDGNTSIEQNPNHTYAAEGTYSATLTVKDATQATATASVTITVTGGGTCTVDCIATVPTSGTTGTPVDFASTFAISGCEGDLIFAWTFGDQTLPSTDQDTTHTYAAPGTYLWTFTLTVDGQVCNQGGTITITDGGGCSLTCTATVPGTGAVGAPVNFASTAAATDCTGQVRFLWSFGDESVPSMEQNPSHTYAEPGTYLWSLTVTVGANPVVCFREGTLVIQGGDPCVSDTSFPDWKAEYWNNNELSGNPVLTKNETGLIIDHDWGEGSPYPGCVNPDYFSVRWTRDIPFASRGTYKFSMGSDDGSRLSVDGSPDLFSGWQWGVHAYQINYIYLTLNPGTHRVVMELFENEVYAQALLQITPEVAPCSFTCEASAAPVSIPAPNSAQFSGSVASYTCAGEPWYHWTFGDGGFSDEANPVYTYGAPGSYNWSLVVTGDGVVCYQTGTVTVGEECPAVTINQNPQDQTIQAGQSATLSVQATSDLPLYYQWFVGESGNMSNPVPDSNTPTYQTPPLQTTTRYWVAVGNTCRTVFSRTATVTVAGSGIPGDCNGDGTVSIGEVQKAINMFLGIEPVGCGADCNGDGSISIGEVQKVINCFLGVANSC